MNQGWMISKPTPLNAPLDHLLSTKTLFFQLSGLLLEQLENGIHFNLRNQKK